MFFLVSEKWLSEDCGQIFDTDSPAKLNKSEWFWYVSVNHPFRIIIPNKLIMNIDARNRLCDTEIELRDIWTLGWWVFQLDKNIRKKIIKCSVSHEELRQLMHKIYWEVTFL